MTPEEQQELLDRPVAEIVPLLRYGTNSTMFTDCCYTAICDDERRCPSCGRLVVGASEKNSDARRRTRWENATRYWKR